MYFSFEYFPVLYILEDKITLVYYITLQILIIQCYSLLLWIVRDTKKNNSLVLMFLLGLFISFPFIAIPWHPVCI